MTGHSSEQTRRADAFDELAALFLTDANPATAVEAPLREPAFRELLIVGNLPVRGGVWLTPYADAIARENGPTALVRFDLEPPTMELLHAAGSVNEPAPADFKDAVLRAANEVAVWIVRGPASANAADLLDLEFDRITILSSADSAAVVAAYRIIKDIVNAAEERSLELPRVALAIAGADERDAKDVVRRMNETASAQLGVTIELAHCLARMDAGVRCETFASFTEKEPPTVRDLLEWLDAAAGEEAWSNVEEPAADGDAEELLEELHEDDRPPLRLAPTIDDDAPSLTVNEEEDEMENEREMLLEDDDLTAEDVEAHESLVEIEMIPRQPAAPPRAAEIAQHNGVRLAPKPVAPTQHESKTVTAAAAHDDALSLASFIAGLAPLPVRCPAHEEVELASDETGRVHVLAHEGSLRELRVVENWARAHRKLIAMACADRNIDERSEITCHIFTDKPATLADLHNTGLRLHVLAPVKVGNQTAWYAAPLSR